MEGLSAEGRSWVGRSVGFLQMGCQNGRGSIRSVAMGSQSGGMRMRICRRGDVMGFVMGFVMMR